MNIGNLLIELDLKNNFLVLRSCINYDLIFYFLKCTDVFYFFFINFLILRMKKMF